MTSRRGAPRWFAATALLIFCFIRASAQLSAVGLIQRIDATVHTRYEHVLGFTDVEHYQVVRGQDQTHPVATMTVKVTYRKGVGKSYEIVAHSGSQIIQKFGLTPLLENEKKINNPATVAQSWFTSANYEMTPRMAEERSVNGVRCIPVSIKPKHKAPNMIDGTLWVDARDAAIVRVEGIASQSPSIFAGKTKMMRDYAPVDGYGMAMHARAESNSKLFGKTVVLIDYSQYHLQTR